ncbi:hypothetical protein [Paracoccus sphaerophysae]|uniref:hypothetical protein n=1 Tax=Paracoccus sphaerophysae TaxID=690417 RepID=UPI00235A158D|nr:hypothetical protein [Paracoccus sphaerophysae]
MQKPDSVLDAAKKAADALGLPWADVQPLYRQMQAGDDPWLPKSVGRKIFTAHPHYIARLLIALGFRSLTPDAANRIARGLAVEGRGMSLLDWPAANVTGCVEGAFARLLTSPEAAEAVAAVEFDPAEKRILIRYKNGHELRFAPTSVGMWPANGDPFREAILEALGSDTRSPFYSVGVITGAALAEISRSVSWRTGPSPIEMADDDTQDES